MKFRLLLFCTLIFGITHRAFLQEIDEDSPLWLYRDEKLISFANVFRREASFPKDYVFEDDEDDIAYREEQKNKVPIAKINTELEPLIIEEKKINNQLDLTYEKHIPGIFSLKNSLMIANALLANENIDSKLESMIESNKVLQTWKYVSDEANKLDCDNIFFKYYGSLLPIVSYEREIGKIFKTKNNINVVIISNHNFESFELGFARYNLSILNHEAIIVLIIFIEDYFVGCIADKKAGHRAKYTLVCHKQIDQKAKDSVQNIINFLEN